MVFQDKRAQAKKGQCARLKNEGGALQEGTISNIDPKKSAS